MNKQVFKFGGTSIGSIEAVRLAVGHVRAAIPGVTVVVSAMSGVTDLLLGAAHGARAGDLAPLQRACEALRERHLLLCHALVASPERTAELSAMVDQAVQELSSMCQSVAILRELSPRTLDATVARGERMLARIFCAVLQEQGVAAVYVDATEVVHMSRQVGSLWPDFSACQAACAEKILPALGEGKVVVVPGYIGRGPEGEVVTLGRGGSDFSAAILARSLGAQQVVLYKEVDGLMTADPRAVREARLLRELHYREAAELAYYGAKILHPRTMIPLLAEQIPLYIRNTFHPESTSGATAYGGTRIAGDIPPSSYPVRALSAVPGQAILAVEGGGMMGVPGMAGRTFTALSQAGHSVTMISQGSSEASICLVLPAAEAESARRALLDCFAAEISSRLIETVRVEPDVALLSVVGLGMRGTPGIAARTFTALSRERLNVLAIAQGSSELNITVALHEKDAGAALRALHREFQLDRQRPLGDDAHRREASITCFGFGQIGQALAQQMARQARYFQDEQGFRLQTVALLDRSGLLLREGGLSEAELLELAARKRGGQPLGEIRAAGEGLVGAEALLRERVWSLPSRRPLFVDLTATDSAMLVLQALRHGCHVVLANKKPLTVPLSVYQEMMDTAQRRGLQLRYEATVGAGLPVLDTLSKLREAGDPVDQMVGCLSGTLGYVMMQIEEGVPLSEAVRRAHALGYTEPDPRDDLSGLDVARKALILARSQGLQLELADVALQPLLPPELSSGERSAEQLFGDLQRFDAELRVQGAAARERGLVLRYVARIDIRAGKAQVGLEAVPEASPMRRLRGTDNQIVLHTRRYRENPLVVIGPGAGADVTAAGVLNDILAIARGA